MVLTGLEILLTERIHDLENLSVGVLANHTAVTRNFTHIADALIGCGVQVKALYAPEHGVRGDIAAGVDVGDCTDDRLGVPVYSLYGSNKDDASLDLSGIDLMLIDLQDVGARHYTHLAIIKSTIIACAKAGVRVCVLDRPNPLSGAIAEGPVMEDDFVSLVGISDIPIRYALTIGETVRLISSGLDAECELEIIRMKNWSRGMWYDSTGLGWVMPSPNIPSLDTAIVYPGTCLLEGTNVSEGRGTTRPFEMFGAPWINAQKLRDELQSYNLPGVFFREAYFLPSDSKHKGQRCAGVQIHVTDRQTYKPVLTGIAVISAIAKLYPEEFEFIQPSKDRRFFFDLLAGNSWIRQSILNGKSPDEIASKWADRLAVYELRKKDYFLYED